MAVGLLLAPDLRARGGWLPNLMKDRSDCRRPGRGDRSRRVIDGAFKRVIDGAVIPDARKILGNASAASQLIVFLLSILL